MVRHAGGLQISTGSIGTSLRRWKNGPARLWNGRTMRPQFKFTPVCWNRLFHQMFWIIW